MTARGRERGHQSTAFTHRGCCLLGMRVGHHGSGGAEDEPGERVRPVPFWAVGEREEDRPGDAEGLAKDHDPLRIDLAREGAREASEKCDDASRKPRAKSAM